MSQRRGRRTFLKELGAATAGAASAVALPGPIEAEPAGRPAPQVADAPPVNTYQFLSPDEAAFVEAVVDAFIPADELSPSGTDCGVSVFIDRQLAGAWGKGDRLYNQGPWAEGTPTQGYQLPMTPAEFVRAGIAATNAYCVQTHARELDRLPDADRIAVLRGLEAGEVDLDRLPGREFFNVLHAAAMEGFFADPIHGGNRDKVSWRMLGFPGVIAVYADAIKTYRNRPYDGEPTSIADLA